MIPYDATELAICLDLNTYGNGECSERFDGTAEEADALVAEGGDALGWTWSVYWHLKEGGVDWVADFHKDCRVEADLLNQAMEEFVERHKDDP